MYRVIIIIGAFELITIGILSIFLSLLIQKIRGLQCKIESAEMELEEWRDKLLEKVKEKILLSEQCARHSHRENSAVSDFTYKTDDIKQLGNDLFEIFSLQISSLKISFPRLTELDLLVLCLLGIGMDNLEICTLLRMEKRTLYRRRQLIAMRIGVSSTHLDQFAKIQISLNSQNIETKLL